MVELWRTMVLDTVPIKPCPVVMRDDHLVLICSHSRRTSMDRLEEQCTLSPESTTNTRDSGIESIANRLSEDRTLGGGGAGSSFGSSPELEPASTGNDQVDQALLWHLSYCDRLIEVCVWALVSTGYGSHWL